MTTNEYIYLIRESTFVTQNESTYTIGRTSRMPYDRINEYPLGSELILVKLVQDSIKIKSIIIKIFSLIFEKKDCRNQCFSGNVNDMTQIIDNVISGDANELIRIIENIINQNQNHV
jgi:hypothetical protein